MEKINIEYNNNYQVLVDFIKETKEGLYTTKIPVVVDFKYQRVDIQEQSEVIDIEEYQEGSYLFGITS